MDLGLGIRNWIRNPPPPQTTTSGSVVTLRYCNLRIDANGNLLLGIPNELKVLNLLLFENNTWKLNLASRNF